MVLTHGDEVLLRHARAARVVMGQFADGMADGVIDRATHLDKKGEQAMEEMLILSSLFIRYLVSNPASSPLRPPGEVF